MITLLRQVWLALLFDEVAAKRWLRAGLMALAGSGLGFAHDIGDALAMPAAAKWIRVAAIVAGFASVAINLGEPNAKAAPPAV